MAVGVLGLVLVAFLVTRALVADEGGASETMKVRLVPANDAGPHPFTVDASAVDPDPAVNFPALPPPTWAGSAPASTPSADAGITVVSVSPDAEVLYASQDDPPCEVGVLREALSADDSVTAIWAELMGIELEDVGRRLDELTPLILGHDTAVTSSLYRDGEGTRFPAILQAGTAVLVDGHGVPRVQCSCGNPLDEAETFDSEAIVEGTPWDDFSASEVISVARSEEPLPTVRSFDLVSGETVDAHLGGLTTIDGYLVDDDEGVFVVSRAGERNSLLDHPVDRVFDDGHGGILFQHRRTTTARWSDAVYTRPRDEREAAIWHLPAGAVEPVALFESSDPETHWYALQGGGLLAGEPVVVYSEVTWDPFESAEALSTQVSLVVLSFLDGSERTMVPVMPIYEGAFGPVTMVDDRIALDIGHEFDAWDMFTASGQEVVSGCGYPMDGITSCKSTSALRSANEFVALHVDETGFAFSVYSLDATSGDFLRNFQGDAAAEAAKYNPPSHIDAFGDEAVVSWSRRPYDPGSSMLPTLRIDLEADESSLLGFTGRTRILRAPLVRPLPTSEEHIESAETDHPDADGYLEVSADAVGDWEFGSPAASALGSLSQRLGQPDEDTGWRRFLAPDELSEPGWAMPGHFYAEDDPLFDAWQHRFHRRACWSTLCVHFGGDSEADGRLLGWELYQYGEVWTEPSPKVLLAGTGIGLGSTWAELQVAYPGVTAGGAEGASLAVDGLPWDGIFDGVASWRLSGRWDSSRPNFAPDDARVIRLSGGDGPEPGCC